MYLLNLQFGLPNKVQLQTKSILQPMSEDSFARNTTLPSRYSVVEYIASQLTIHQELGGTKKAISDTTVICHFLFEPYHDLSTLSPTTMTTIGVLTVQPQ